MLHGSHDSGFESPPTQYVECSDDNRMCGSSGAVWDALRYIAVWFKHAASRSASVILDRERVL